MIACSAAQTKARRSGCAEVGASRCAVLQCDVVANIETRPEGDIRSDRRGRSRREGCGRGVGVVVVGGNRCRADPTAEGRVEEECSGSSSSSSKPSAIRRHRLVAGRKVEGSAAAT